MDQYSIVQWISFFYFYCFFGWCFESTYVSLKSKKFVNRGFMKGPFLPLYGSGAIMMLVVSIPFQSLAMPQRLISVYFAGCIGATALEYVTGVTMEALFKVRYWDYSYKKIQFQGHICLSSTLAWGGLTILMTEVVHQHVLNVSLWMPKGLLTVITYGLTAVLFADFAVAFKNALTLRDILIKMEQAKEEIARLQKRMEVMIALTEEDFEIRKTELHADLDSIMTELKEDFSELREDLGEHIEDLEQRKEEIAQRISNQISHWELKRENMLVHIEKSMKSMIHGNPTMVSVKFRASLEEMKQRIEQEIDSHMR